MGTTTRLLTVVGLGLATVGFVGTLSGHTDDPKGQEYEPLYTGAGFRSAVDKEPPVAYGSSGVELLSWITIGEFGTGANSANDCWGYTSPGGREYAIICLANATAFVDITNPSNPDIVETISAPNCTWHDVKVFEDHAYVVSECGSGIQVIDMSGIDAGVVTFVRNVTTGGQDSHNIALDPVSGYAYRTGGSGNGLLIYDLNASKSNPPLVASWPDRYVHDAQVFTYPEGTPYAGRQIAFCNSGFNGGGTETGMDILDVTDKNNIIQMARMEYPNNAYSHQGWLSDDYTLFYMNDESDEQSFGVTTTTHIIDVSDLENPAEITTFTSGLPSIDHNLYVRGNLIFEANYTSGLRVFDASDPLAPVEIGFYDTYPANDNAQFAGIWSCYPFYDSGIVIGSDTSRGLFVWSVRSRQVGFAYPDGQPVFIDPAGDTVRVDVFPLVEGGVVPDTETLHYDAGEGWIETPLVDLGGDAFEAVFPAFPCGTDIDWYVSAEASDGLEETSPAGAPSDTWSTVSASDLIVAFEDDMESDPGYTVENVDLEDGAWDRGVPVGGGDRGDPAQDFDGSGAAWLTDNADGNTDVDGGPTRLITPAIDLSALAAPKISYARWFTNDDGDEDRLDVHVSDDDGDTWVLVESVGDQGASWKVHEFAVEDFVEATSTVRLRFSATDNPNNSLTEAGIDALRVVSLVCEEAVPGDVDGDGDVDFDDLLLILAAWGPCEGECPEDLDTDGMVGFNDLLIVLANWTP